MLYVVLRTPFKMKRIKDGSGVLTSPYGKPYLLLIFASSSFQYDAGCKNEETDGKPFKKGGES